MARRPAPTLSPTRRRFYRGGGAVASADPRPTGGGGGPGALVPRPLRWLGDLPQHSVGLAQRQRGAGGRGRGGAGRGGVVGRVHLTGRT